MAKLINFRTKAVIAEFDYSPEAISTTAEIKYGNYDTAMTVSTPMTWGNSPGRRYTFNDVIISSFRKRTSVQATLDALLQLRNPDGNTGSPPMVQMQFGSRNLPPCYLTELTINETAWLKDTGEPTDSRISFTLVEASDIAKEGLNGPVTAQRDTLNKLTPREVEAARRASRGHTVNPNTWQVFDSNGNVIGMALPDTPHFINQQRLRNDTNLFKYQRERFRNFTNPAARDR